MNSNQTIQRFTLPATAMTNVQYKLQGKYLRIDSSDDMNSIVTVSFSSPSNPTLEMRVGSQYCIPDGYRDEINNTFRVFITKAATSAVVNVLVSESELPDRAEITRNYTRRIVSKEVAAIDATKTLTLGAFSRRGKLESIVVKLVSITGSTGITGVIYNSSNQPIGGFGTTNNGMQSGCLAFSGYAQAAISNTAFHIFQFQPMTVEVGDYVVVSLASSNGDTLSVYLSVLEEV